MLPQRNIDVRIASTGGSLGRDVVLGGALVLVALVLITPTRCGMRA